MYYNEVEDWRYAIALSKKGKRYRKSLAMWVVPCLEHEFGWHYLSKDTSDEEYNILLKKVSFDELWKRAIIQGAQKLMSQERMDELFVEDLEDGFALPCDHPEKAFTEKEIADLRRVGKKLRSYLRIKPTASLYTMGKKWSAIPKWRRVYGA